MREALQPNDMEGLTDLLTAWKALLPAWARDFLPFFALRWNKRAAAGAKLTRVAD